MLSGSELWLLRLMADRGLALLDADGLIVVIEEGEELRVAAASGTSSPRLRIVPSRGSALGAIYAEGQPLALERPRGDDAAWLYELGIEARAVLVEPLQLEDQGGGLVIALRHRAVASRSPTGSAVQAFAASVSQRLAAERSVEIERLRYGMQAREHERTRWAREIHDESIQGIGALRLQLANARDNEDPAALRAAVDAALEGLGHEIDGLRHLITELRPAALDDLGLAAALEALARRAQAIDGLDVRTEIDLSGIGRAGHGAANGNGGTERMDAELESTVYRVAQEALTNVSRHAEATSAVVAVSAHDGALELSVTDDGKGMPGQERLGPRGDGLEGGFGMSGMRERAELVGGELKFRPGPGKGTEVRPERSPARTTGASRLSLSVCDRPAAVA